MAATPPFLQRYKTKDGGLSPDMQDQALVKVRTLKAFAAWLISQIPVPGGGLSLRRSPDGDVWSQGAVEDVPFKISPAGKVAPAMVGSVMPTIGGDPLNATTNVLDLSQDGDVVYFQLNFTVPYVESYLAAGWTLDSVSVEQAASLPSDTDDTKYLQFNSISGGAPYGPSYFTQSINVRLIDNGVSATLLEYNP